MILKAMASNFTPNRLKMENGLWKMRTTTLAATATLDNQSLDDLVADLAPKIGDEFADEVINAGQRVGSEIRAQRARVADLRSRTRIGNPAHGGEQVIAVLAGGDPVAAVGGRAVESRRDFANAP